jgi:BTB/POZ domain
MYIYGGSDGKVLEDFRSLNLPTNIWAPVCIASASSSSKTPSRTIPTALQTSTSSSSKTAPYTHDKTPQGAMVWSEQGTDNDVFVVGCDVMQIEGGHARSLWSRRSHIAVAHRDNIFTFGGYDGTKRLNDFLKLSFVPDTLNAYVPPSVLACGLKELVGSDKYSDITFIVEGKRAMAHKILCMRCPSLQNTVPIKCEDGGADEMVVADIGHDTFSSLLEFLYSDACDVDANNVTDLFHAADRFD